VLLSAGCGRGTIDLAGKKAELDPDAGPGAGGATASPKRDGGTECATNDDCKAPTGVCAGGRCVVCTNDDHCAALGLARLAPHCDTTAHRCVRCLADDDCGYPLPVCDQAQGACVQCGTGADCASYYNSTVCSNHMCVCASDTDCINGAVCESAEHHCEFHN